MPLPNYLLVLLLFLYVVSLQFIVNVHVHVILLHGCQFLLDTSADIVFSLFDGLHLDEDVIELAGMLSVYIYVQNLQILLYEFAAVFFRISVLVVEHFCSFNVLQKMQPYLHLEDL